MQPQKRWNAARLLELGRSYQPAAIYAAAADLELFDAIATGELAPEALAQRLRCDLRGLLILLDALVATELLRKRAGRYSLAPGTGQFLTSNGRRSILAMGQHQANCMRAWVQLACVIKTGKPAERTPSVRGADGDAQAFIGAMHNVSLPQADKVVRALRPSRFKRLLDVGGASGTWTMAFLRANPEGRAILFDLPHVIPMARSRLSAGGYLKRVKLVEGDFMTDRLPRGADLAWVSAIVHQNSRSENRALFLNVNQALAQGGMIAIRDIVMQPDRTEPVAGAFFAINMLVATRGGGTFTLEELRADLEAAGFNRVRLVREDPGMSSVVAANKAG
jgi:predicted O-methyltransferase YrrM